MRINKFLAEHGIASRRGCDEIVAEGRVTINGKVAKAGDDVTPSDTVMLDGKTLSHKVKYEYYLLNKPKGYVCTVSDDKGRKTVMDLLPAAAAVYPQNMEDFWCFNLDDPLLAALPADQEPQLVLIQLDGLR